MIVYFYLINVTIINKIIQEYNHFFIFVHRLNSASHEKRLQEVKNEIFASGIYNLTETELIYGAKLAWRNSARCIGRIQWSKLQVSRFSTHFLIQLFKH